MQLDVFQIFAGFFDTTFGPKNEAESYRTIKTEIEKNCEADSVNSEEILFLTDNPEGKLASTDVLFSAMGLRISLMVCTMFQLHTLIIPAKKNSEGI